MFFLEYVKKLAHLCNIFLLIFYPGYFCSTEKKEKLISARTSSWHRERRGRTGVWRSVVQFKKLFIVDTLIECLQTLRSAVG